MTGESLGQARIRADLDRQTAEQQNHLAVRDIERSYAPQIAALAHPARTNASPD